MLRAAFLVHAILWAVLSAACSSSEPAVPIDGTWELLVPGTTCTEAHTFKAGTRTFVSNEERGTSRYDLIFNFEPGGLPQIQDTIVTTNGGLDCSGKKGAPVGDVATLFLRFNEKGDELLLCGETKLDSCFGPLRKHRDG